MARKIGIGSVDFGKKCSSKENAAGWKLYPAAGKERLELLAKAMTSEELPHNLFLVAQNGGGGYKRIGYDEVNWDEFTSYLNKGK